MRGFKAQGMNGRKDAPFDAMPIKLLVQPQNPAMSGNWVVPKSGRYLIALHGCGGLGGIATGVPYPGGPGGLCIRTVNLLAGQVIAYAVAGWNSSATSTVTFSDGVMQVTAGGGFITAPGGLGGVATGGDININGTQGTTQAASYGDILGGLTTGSGDGHSAGAPGVGQYDGANNSRGGSGRLLAIFLGGNAGAGDTP